MLMTVVGRSRPSYPQLSAWLVLKEGIPMADAVHWLMHQIISYGFFGVKGANEKQQKADLEKMVVSVII